MCGITGILAWKGDRQEMLHPCGEMVSELKHRGPDDIDTWSDVHDGIALGHSRLSIIDLSDNGHQPMISANKRWVIAYNGEIYNTQELRSDLEKNGVNDPDLRFRLGIASPPYKQEGVRLGVASPESLRFRLGVASPPYKQEAKNGIDG